ncbi:hypothetical protein DFP72DRAFT_839537 [Ephemerocybe angulata]|uniref:Uncharacterized protein n=1 Tax=Ephemerocybe angulata TaxID=980116 RepID=A0A8H6MGI7_9AGAR|nr:hypothetical protein DFP72DRAFT_839537 [Tulosesus angulatus]
MTTLLYLILIRYYVILSAVVSAKFNYSTVRLNLDQCDRKMQHKLIYLEGLIIPIPTKWYRGCSGGSSSMALGVYVGAPPNEIVSPFGAELSKAFSTMMALKVSFYSPFTLMSSDLRLTQMPRGWLLATPDVRSDSLLYYFELEPWDERELRDEFETIDELKS